MHISVDQALRDSFNVCMSLSVRLCMSVAPSDCPSVSLCMSFCLVSFFQCARQGLRMQLKMA